MSVDLSEEEIVPYLKEFQDSLCIACFNSPQNVTVSGDESAIDILRAKLAANDVSTAKLRTGAAYHSSQMQKIAQAYHECLNDLNGRDSEARQRVKMYSSVTGMELTKKGMFTTPEYWVRNLVQPVQYLRAISSMASGAGGTRRLGSSKYEAINDLVEVGPHPALQRPTRSILDSLDLEKVIRYDFVLHRKRPGLESVLELCGRLWSLGHTIALHRSNQAKTRTKRQGRLLTDLPQYPFNHATSYWHETALSKHSRIRNHPRHELLGTPVAEWNLLEPRWRNIFDSAETPWIEEHRVNGKSIYPATGMVVMAIEGAKQLADSQRKIHAFQVKDAMFSNPIPVGPSDASEVHLFMRSLSNSDFKTSDGYDYRVCTHSGEEWQENSRGEIHVEYARLENEVSQNLNYEEHPSALQQDYSQAIKACSRHIETEKMYHHFQSDGLDYGPSFQTLEDVAWDGESCSIGTIKTFQWAPHQSQHGRQPHIVHPTTLDAVGHLMCVVLTKGITQKAFDGIAATRIKRAWISGSGVDYPETTKLRACSRTSRKGLRGTDTSAFALDERGDLKFSIDHFETTALSGNALTAEIGPPRQISYALAWKPDVNLMNAQQIVSHCKTLSPDVPTPSAFYNDLERILHHFAERALEHTRDVDRSALKPHMQKYLNWLDDQVSKFAIPATLSEATPHLNQPHEVNSTLQRIQDANPEGKLFVTIGRNLAAIIRGNANPLELMFGSGLVNAFYKDVSDKISSSRQMQAYIDILAHKDPSMKVLEIGAGTGGVSGQVAEALCTERSIEHGTARFTQ